MLTLLDWREPQDCFAAVADEPYAALLHGGRLADDARWSIIAARPTARLEASGDALRLDGELIERSPLEALRQRIARHRRLDDGDDEGPPLPFRSGLIGFMGYEMAAAFEPAAPRLVSPYPLPDMAFGDYDAALVFDRAARRLYLCEDAPGAGDHLRDAHAAAFRSVAIRLDGAPAASTMSRARFEGAVREVIERIRAGDLFQANIAHRLWLDIDRDTPTARLAAALLGDHAAPLAAVINHENAAILSNSPERFLRITPGISGMRIIVDPIKGTRARSDDPAIDEARATALLNDPKERAENIMIAELMRNDLSRVCRDGTVSEDYICAIRSYARVHHLVSRISGVLRDDVDGPGVFAAIFPCGSITGAPKIEAMSVIAALEGEGRGPYCGAIGYLDGQGGAEFSVAIRTAVFDRAAGRLNLSVGGGVTLRSQPAAEYDETLDKAQATLQAFGGRAPTS